MRPTEKALREQMERLKERNAFLSTQVDVLSELNELVCYDRDRFVAIVCNIEDLLAFCRATGCSPTLDNLEDCVAGKSVAHLITDLPAMAN